MEDGFAIHRLMNGALADPEANSDHARERPGAAGASCRAPAMGPKS
jgi:hypothetical protein